MGVGAGTVFFATNRVVAGDGLVVGSYGDGIQDPGEAGGLVYGTAFVSGLDTQANAQGRIDLIEDTNVGGFSAGAVGDLQDGGRNIMVFLHGFDNSFSDAITRAAFNRQWLTEAGTQAADMAMIAFSWPSLGQVVDGPVLPSAYKRDQAMARLSGGHLAGFFKTLAPILQAARAQGCRTYLLAHSMGNLALQAAVEQWFVKGQAGGTLFDAAFLAAADCGFDAFDQPFPFRLSGLSRLSERVVIYYSHIDQVLQLSTVVNIGARRLGQDGPDDKSDTAAFPPDTFTMVSATGFTDYAVNFLTSHQYYRQSAACRADITSRL